MLPAARWAPVRWAVALGATALAFGLNLALLPWVGPNTFPPFLAAVMVATWFGGLGPGLAAVVASTLATWYVFLPPRFSFAVEDAATAVRLVLFAASATLIAGLGSALRSAQLRAEAAGAEAQRLADLHRERETEVRASESRFRGLLEMAPDGIVIVDQQGRITLANTQAQKMFGYTAEELVGQPVELLVPEPLRSAHAGHRAAYQAQPRTRPMGVGLELAGRRKDGSQFPVEISLSPVETEDGRLVISVVRDITERRRAEARIRALNEDLARRYAELEAANRELEAFSYSVSHDLRAPLRAIDGFSQALLEDCEPVLDERGRDHLRRIRAATRRMGELIDDLLALARVTRQEMRRERVDLSAVARSVVAQLRRAEPTRRVEVVIAEGLAAEGDPHLLRLVLENLLGNAWKFTAREPEARIEFGALDEGGRPAFFVRDNGVGFDMAYAHKLFGPFQRLHPTSEFPGTGIGLATVQRVVARHGGRVWAVGEEGKGATFFFTLGEPWADVP
ncbi:MAG TPA: PAS domain S-box protein [Calidithermus sp.]|nr:PAS domain S-box protein [Calidithermus sp.]